MRTLTVEERNTLMVRHRELIKSFGEPLGSLDRQRKHVAELYAAPMACPLCGTPVPIVLARAAHLAEEGKPAPYPFDTDKLGSIQHGFNCPECTVPLEHAVPFIGQEHWVIKLTRDQAMQVSAFVRQLLKEGARKNAEDPDRR